MKTKNILSINYNIKNFLDRLSQFDYLVVGAGISGATIAEQTANLLNKKVLVIDKRDHIGGNCYDYYNNHGILVPKYGPHFFHTNDEKVWSYVSRFTQWNPYEHRVLSCVDSNLLVPIPINITTVNKLFNLNLKTEKDMQNWLRNNTKKIAKPKNSEEVALNRVGKILYEKLFKKYTIKQWNIHPKDLDPLVMSRIPVRTNYDDRYFTDKYQGMPKDGYTALFEKMLNHPNITICLNADYFKLENYFKSFQKIFFTGRIDLFFKKKTGKLLQYRSLKFKHETKNKEYFQTRAQINYPNTEIFTRITEPKHATGQKHPKTTIIKETSTWQGEPFYPVPTEQNKKIYEDLQKEAEKLSKNGIYFVGRIAQYRYFNMDEAFKNALSTFHQTK